MVTIKDGCGCDPCDCDWKQKLKEAYSRAIQSVNKVGDFDGSVYFPDGSGFVKLPIPKLSDVQQISQNKQDITDLKAADVQLQANITAEENARIASITAEENARIASITAEETARKAKDENLDNDIARIDSTDARQSELIQDNADRITSTYNDLVSTEATVATHDSEIITLKANNQAIVKSLVSDVLMTDGTTAGSVQVSIERKDGTLITSANYRWGKDIGIRLEAGTQAGYVKAVISLSDGTELVSNEYKIVEVLESDVYVTAITLIADQAAGTLGGNISYSNGTTQTINSVSVPTAPGVTSAIEALQGRMTAVEQKNVTQDASITAIDERVQALENTPAIGQFANGRLGTIAGSTTDGRIKAENNGTGSVNGWSALKQRVTTAESNIVTAQGDISDLNRRVGTHDTEINGKVSISQGVANAGKVLGIGSDGNVTPTEVSAVGEDWEEVDLSNFPTDWVAGDIIRFIPYEVNITFTVSSWGTKPNYTSGSFVVDKRFFSPMVTIPIPSTGTSSFSLSLDVHSDTKCIDFRRGAVNDINTFNSGDNVIIIFTSGAFNGGGYVYISNGPKRSNVSDYIYKMWRLKK